MPLVSLTSLLNKLFNRSKPDYEQLLSSTRSMHFPWRVDRNENGYRIVNCNDEVVAWVQSHDPQIAEWIVSECNRAEKRRNQEYQEWLHAKDAVYQR